MDIITAYAVKNDCYKTAQKCIPKGIVVHSTGANNPYLKRYVDAPNEVGVNVYGNHWNNPSSVLGRSVCVHSFIGYDKNNKVRVANILPYNYCCWGVGSGRNGSYNYNPAYIQFEMCEDGLRDRAYFEAVRDTAIEYCAYLCNRFSIPVSNIVSHKGSLCTWLREQPCRSAQLVEQFQVHHGRFSFGGTRKVVVGERSSNKTAVPCADGCISK